MGGASSPQVDPGVDRACFQRLKPERDGPLSNCAFNSNLRRCTKDPEKAARKAAHLKKKAEEEVLERAARTAEITAARAAAAEKAASDAADAAENPAAAKKPAEATSIKLPRGKAAEKPQGKVGQCRLTFIYKILNQS